MGPTTKISTTEEEEKKKGKRGTANATKARANRPVKIQAALGEWVSF